MGEIENKMTTINIKKEKCTIDDKILKELGYTLKWNVYSRKIELSKIRKEIERLQVLRIPDIEVVLD